MKMMVKLILISLLASNIACATRPVLHSKSKESLTTALDECAPLCQKQYKTGVYAASFDQDTGKALDCYCE